ncbi:MAG: peroxidase, partial [Gemmatimonadota bacterium]|nr:peroxidase [Gemmatimonadota bacterium]
PRGGHHLGPVGGRVVAEVLVGLAWNDHHSFLYQDPLWHPQPPVARADGTFEMSDLIAFTDG